MEQLGGTESFDGESTASGGISAADGPAARGIAQVFDARKPNFLPLFLFIRKASYVCYEIIRTNYFAAAAHS